MDTPIRMPFLERRLDNLQIQKGPFPDDNGTTPFNARSFVVLAAGIIVPVVTAGVLCLGQSPDASHLSTDIPPAALYSNRHWVFNPRDCQFIINITDNAGNVGQANGAPQLSEVVIGTRYGLYRNATTKMQFLNVDDTTNDFFEVISIYNGISQALTDYNGLVLVKLIESVIQA